MSIQSNGVLSRVSLSISGHLKLPVRTIHQNIQYFPRLKLWCSHVPPRDFSTSIRYASENVAILGGGITGLACAHYLSEESPDTHITIYERSSRSGGWIDTEAVDVGNGEVLFEKGPRSLRPSAPNGTLVLRLIEKLSLTEDLLITPRTSPAAQNRYIYYPDHLVRMPQAKNFLGNFYTVLTEPLFTGLIRGAIHDLNVDKIPPDREEDESVGEFITRRANQRVADNIVSAVFHGIYAGDIWKLSARSILPLQWAQEAKYGSMAQAAFESIVQKRTWRFCDDVNLQMKLSKEGEWSEGLNESRKNCSVFTFKRGLIQLVEKLEQWLTKSENVTIKRDCSVSGLKLAEDSETVQVTTTSPRDAEDEASATPRDQLKQEEHIHTGVISTLPSPALVSCVNNASKPLKSSLGNIHAVTVCVVNFHFAKLLSLPRGFGYLIPRTIPFAQNPEHALGVVFDSDITPDLHSTVAEFIEPGTRLTVMLGGHWWDDYEPSDYPSPSTAIDMARSVLKRHLGIDAEPSAASATLQRDCIPQYTVGHEDRMAQGHDDLEDHFGGRVRVAGCSYTGVGVNDCVRAAWELVQGLTGIRKVQGELFWSEPGKTGLERFTRPRGMALVRKEGSTLVVEKLDEAARQSGSWEHWKSEK